MLTWKSPTTRLLYQRAHGNRLKFGGIWYWPIPLEPMSPHPKPPIGWTQLFGKLIFGFKSSAIQAIHTCPIDDIPYIYVCISHLSQICIPETSPRNLDNLQEFTHLKQFVWIRPTPPKMTLNHQLPRRISHPPYKTIPHKYPIKYPEKHVKDDKIKFRVM